MPKHLIFPRGVAEIVVDYIGPPGGTVIRVRKLYEMDIKIVDITSRDILTGKLNQDYKRILRDRKLGCVNVIPDDVYDRLNLPVNKHR